MDHATHQQSKNETLHKLLMHKIQSTVPGSTTKHTSKLQFCHQKNLIDYINSLYCTTSKAQKPHQIGILAS